MAPLCRGCRLDATEVLDYRALQLFTQNIDQRHCGVTALPDNAALAGHVKGASEIADIRSRLVDEVPRLRRYARALTRNVTAADDLVQDCLSRAVSKSPSGRKVPTSGRGCSLSCATSMSTRSVAQGARGKSAALCNAEPVTMAPDQEKRLKVQDLERALAKTAGRAAIGAVAGGDGRHAGRRSFCRSRRAGGHHPLEAVARAGGTAPVDEHGNRAGPVRPRRGRRRLLASHPPEIAIRGLACSRPRC
jgi:hypothetical protein